MAKKITFTEWDTSAHLKTPADIQHYLDAVLEQDDPELLKFAIDQIARGMSQIPNN